MSHIPSPDQNDALLTFLESHQELACGRLRNVEGRHRAKDLWARLTNELNSLGPCRKNVKQWQKVWADKKYLAKKAAAAARQTGVEPGPSSAGVLTPLELRIISLMEECNRESDTSILVSTDTRNPAPHGHSLKTEPTSVDSSADDNSSDDESQRETLQHGTTSMAPPWEKSRKKDSDREMMRRLLEIEEQRVALDAQRAQSLADIRDSMQEMSRFLQITLQDILQQMRLQRTT